jgi:hypothetical protein
MYAAQQAAAGAEGGEGATGATGGASAADDTVVDAEVVDEGPAEEK